MINVKPTRAAIPQVAAGVHVFNGPAPARAVIPTAAGLPKAAFHARAAGRAFSIEASAEVAEIALYDEIGYWGVNAETFRDRLKAITAPTIVLRINSPGGEVFDGLAMHNDLVDHPANIHVVVTGIAASAASVVAMAGDKISIAPNAFFMIHDASTGLYGNKQDFRKYADVLETIDGSLAKTYAHRTGADIEDIRAMMTAETWMDAETAIAEGFAEAAPAEEDAAGATAAFDVSMFRNAPALVVAKWAKRPAISDRDLERALRDAGLSKNAAQATIARGWRSVRDAPGNDGRASETPPAIKWDATAMNRTLTALRNFSQKG